VGTPGRGCFLRDAGARLGLADLHESRPALASRTLSQLDGKTVYSEGEVIDFLARVKARGPSRAPWRGTQTAVSSERPGDAAPGLPRSRDKEECLFGFPDRRRGGPRESPFPTGCSRGNRSSGWLRQSRRASAVPCTPCRNARRIDRPPA
jgi:hypothetical protein